MTLDTSNPNALTANSANKSGSTGSGAAADAPKPVASGGAPQPVALSIDTLNPIDNPEAYCRMTVGGAPIPGAIQEITGGGRKYKWEQTKPTGKGGSSTNFKGVENCSGLKVKFKLSESYHWADLNTLRRAIEPKSEGEKPPPNDVVNAIWNHNRVKSVVLAVFGEEKLLADGSTDIELEFDEFSPPKPAKTGANDKAGSKGSGKLVEATAKGSGNAELDSLLAKAKA